MGFHSTLLDHPDIKRTLRENGYSNEEIASMRVCRYSARKVTNRIGQVDDDGLRLRVFGNDGSCELVRLKTAAPLTHGK
jgi:hypothetical protein